MLSHPLTDFFAHEVVDLLLELGVVVLAVDVLANPEAQFEIQFLRVEFVYLEHCFSPFVKLEQELRSHNGYEYLNIQRQRHL